MWRYKHAHGGVRRRLLEQLCLAKCTKRYVIQLTNGKTVVVTSNGTCVRKFMNS